MAAIPTILKGDDSGAINITLDTSHTYTGATLVFAYQGVTRTFTDLTAGGTVSVVFTHDETATMKLGAYAVEMELIGSAGGRETVANAEMRIKVTDCIAEVNSGSSFVIRPGSMSGVPVTDVGDLAARYTMAQLTAKVNQIVHVLAQRSLLAFVGVALLCGAAFGEVEVQTARLDALYNDSLVVTNVSGGAGGGADTNAVNDLIRSYDETNLTARIDIRTTTNQVCNIVTNDIGSADWVTNITATSSGKEVTLLNVKWDDVEGVEQWLMYLRVPGIGDAWRGCASPNNTNPNATTLAASEYPELVTTRGYRNALGLAYERDIGPAVSNVVDGYEFATRDSVADVVRTNASGRAKIVSAMITGGADFPEFIEGDFNVRGSSVLYGDVKIEGNISAYDGSTAGGSFSFPYHSATFGSIGLSTERGITLGRWNIEDWLNSKADTNEVANALTNYLAKVDGTSEIRWYGNNLEIGYGAGGSAIVTLPSVFEGYATFASTLTVGTDTYHDWSAYRNRDGDNLRDALDAKAGTNDVATAIAGEVANVVRTNASGQIMSDISLGIRPDPTHAELNGYALTFYGSQDHPTSRSIYVDSIGRLSLPYVIFRDGLNFGSETTAEGSLSMNSGNITLGGGNLVVNDFNNITTPHSGTLQTALNSKADTNDVVTAVAATNVAAAVFTANADYALTNAATSAAFTVRSGEIAQTAISGATLDLTLDFSTAADRSGDCLVYAVCATNATLAILPSATVAPLGSEWTSLAAGTNLICVTRVAYDGGKSVVAVAVKEVK